MSAAEHQDHTHKPVRDWIVLRITALCNIPLVLWLVYSAANLKGADYATFTGWLAQPVHAGLMLLFVIPVFVHAALGSHEIVEDYVHRAGLKKMTIFLINLALFVVGAACVLSVLKVAMA
jgi:succinate dehydrogenase / fumarate reductase membrane anchor subunit